MLARPSRLYVIGWRGTLERRADDLAAWVAWHLPRRVREWVITWAAARYREPDRRAGDRYCGPDGIDYHDLYRNA